MNLIELHYHLPKNVHSMDAYVKNRAEAEVLRILKEISSLLDLEVDFETEALATGGIREFIKIITKKKNRKRTLIVLGYLGVIFSGVATTVIADKITEDKELKDLEKKKIKLEIQKLENETGAIDSSKYQKQFVQNVVNIISYDHRIITFKSNLFQTLQSESSINKFGIRILSEDHKPILEEKVIDKDNFKNYIVPNEISSTATINGAFIEIVSPVLSKGVYKWKGIYNGRQISFNLLDADFKKSVVEGKVSFANGTVIKCDIVIDQAMNQEGDIKTICVDVSGVDEVFQGDIRIETPRLKNKKELANQTKLDL